MLLLGGLCCVGAIAVTRAHCLRRGPHVVKKNRIDIGVIQDKVGPGEAPDASPSDSPGFCGRGFNQMDCFRTSGGSLFHGCERSQYVCCGRGGSGILLCFEVKPLE